MGTAQIVVGIGGSYCAGKDTACAFFAQRGYAIIDVDTIGHRALVEQREALISTFGATICAPDGSIDRATLGKIVFADPKARIQLENITHPIMRRTVTTLIAESTTPHIVINAALLFYMHLHPLCHTILWVTAHWYLRVVRALARDHLSIVRIIQRLRSQRRLVPHILPHNADIYVVRNNSSNAVLQRRLERWYAHQKEVD